MKAWLDERLACVLTWLMFCRSNDRLVRQLVGVIVLWNHCLAYLLDDGTVDSWSDRLMEWFYWCQPPDTWNNLLMHWWNECLVMGRTSSCSKGWLSTFSSGSRRQSLKSIQAFAQSRIQSAQGKELSGMSLADIIQSPSAKQHGMRLVPEEDDDDDNQDLWLHWLDFRTHPRRDVYLLVRCAWIDTTLTYVSFL